MPFGATRFSEGLRMGTEVFHALRGVCKGRGLNTAVGDEGGFAPDLGSDEEAIDLILEAVEKTGLQPGRDVRIALDAASAEFLVDGVYQVNGKGHTPAELSELYAAWVEKYPIFSLEDGLDQDDWEGWETLTAKLGDRLQLVGDDLFVTSTRRLQEGIDRGAGNAPHGVVDDIGEDAAGEGGAVVVDEKRRAAAGGWVHRPRALERRESARG